jgi:hypothetical protein
MHIFIISLISIVILTNVFASNINLITNTQTLNNYRLLLELECNSRTCPSGQGICKGDTCVCLEGYLTRLDIKNTEGVYCNYQQKKTMWALLIESFGLVGFGHIYAGRIFQGIIKMIVFYIIICFGSQFVITFMKENTDTDTAYYVKLIISSACLCLPVIWHLIDLYNFAANNYLDGNGMPMLNW